jgi:hypothetical protein
VEEVAGGLNSSAAVKVAGATRCAAAVKVLAGAVRPVRSRAWEAAQTPGASAIAVRPAGRAASGPVAAVEVAQSVGVEEAVVGARPVAVAGGGGVAEEAADEAEEAEVGDESGEGELDHARAAS